ncbi:predicted protein [Sclerotinia sclerotiorum 1980 UF-70]|uniref:Uncharacterized protein n=1 Tax=Sclerotinia sclerotiorum (strain ATCC 18683 / 1980 / Ss-1) TaxID=665079 RepID=A7ETH9_SCLS1|nr:predicted protein [Sclerotinia sclerotiorum 1980 UF-70]EDN92771.1 predicted protein [Sclerotinia sclerotiorum 1980 UF-70]
MTSLPFITSLEALTVTESSGLASLTQSSSTSNPPLLASKTISPSIPASSQPKSAS